MTGWWTGIVVPRHFRRRSRIKWKLLKTTISHNNHFIFKVLLKLKNYCRLLAIKFGLQTNNNTQKQWVGIVLTHTRSLEFQPPDLSCQTELQTHTSTYLSVSIYPVCHSSTLYQCHTLLTECHIMCHSVIGRLFHPWIFCWIPFGTSKNGNHFQL